jgi:hypothetical protein
LLEDFLRVRFLVLAMVDLPFWFQEFWRGWGFHPVAPGMSL